ncbi:MAG TPA: hypothetical protein VGI97_00405 [Gemmatimonadaceae bacterium]
MSDKVDALLADARAAYPACASCGEDLVPHDGELCGACAQAVRNALKATYAERNQCVALLARMALALGWRAGVRDHEDKPGEEWEADWRNLVCIDLPSGQVSWHFHDSEKHLLAELPQYPAPWDGHDTAEKYRRVNDAKAVP